MSTQSLRSRASIVFNSHTRKPVIMIHLVLFVYLLHFVSSQSIVEISPLLTKDVNETAALLCKVKDLQSSPITWNKQKANGQKLLSFNDRKVIQDNRFSLQIENSSLPYTISILQIEKVQADDAGVYRCSVNDEDKDVTLQIRSPPFIYGNTTQFFNTSLHGNVTFECYGGGYPAPEVTWTRENNGLLPNGASSYQGNVLKMNNVQKDYIGNYYCNVDNKVGQSAKKVYHLNVDYPPIVKARNLRVGQALKFKAQLECIVESSKSVPITWHHGNSLITNNQYYAKSQAAINDQLTSFFLEVTIEEKKVYGTYTCAVNNNFDKGAAHIELYQTEKEVCSQNCSTNSGHSIINMSKLKLSFTAVIILMLNWQNM